MPIQNFDHLYDFKSANISVVKPETSTQIDFTQIHKGDNTKAASSNTDALTNEITTTGDDNESWQAKLSREVSLLSALPGGAFEAAIDKLSHPADLAAAAGGAVLLGLTVVALERNPGIFGEASAKFVTGGLKLGRNLSGPLMGVDWLMRIGSPMVAEWQSADNDSSARASLAQNVGGGVIDYASGMAGVLRGARFADRFAPVVETSFARLAPVAARAELGIVTGRTTHSLYSLMPGINLGLFGSKNYYDHLAGAKK